MGPHGPPFVKKLLTAELEENRGSIARRTCPRRTDERNEGLGIRCLECAADAATCDLRVKNLNLPDVVQIEASDDLGHRLVLEDEGACCPSRLSGPIYRTHRVHRSLDRYHNLLIRSQLDSIWRGGVSKEPLAR